MTYKTTDIVAALREMAHGDRPDDLGEIHRRLDTRFPGIGNDQIKRAFDVLSDELREAKREADAEYRRATREIDEALYLLHGLPANTTIEEAVEIKAAQGDPIALQWRAIMSTRKYRVEEALEQAAYQAHPEWKETPDGHFEWKGDSAMPSEAAMIDWFQMTHPTEARRIEVEIESA
jgi:hypothetical protein